MMIHPRHARIIKTVLTSLSFIVLTAGLALANEGGGEAITAQDWIQRVVAFGIIAGVLGYVVVKVNVKAIMQKRTEGIENALAEAKAAREDALRRLSEVEARLKDKDAEIQSIIKVAEENGAKERELLLAEGERISQGIVESAKENLGAELLKAREALRREAALMAVELAEKLVRENIKKEDQERIVEEYIAKVGA